VVIIGSFGTNPGFKLVDNTETPRIAEEFERAFKVARSLKCDVPLGSHPGMYNMTEKYSKLTSAAANPFIDPAGYTKFLDNLEKAYKEQIKNEQK